MTGVRRSIEDRQPRSLVLVGWREWLVLPDLGVKMVKAKIDTGARTSSLHAFALERFRRRGAPWARFAVHPLQRKAEPQVLCEAEIVDERRVRSSSGHAALRPVIRTRLALGPYDWPIELTLASRDAMGFRMLLGRQALRGRCAVEPGRSYLVGKRPARKKSKKRVRRKKKARKTGKSG